MSKPTLPTYLRLLAQLHRPRTIAQLARRLSLSDKTVRRELIHLQRLSFTIRSRQLNRHGAKAYHASAVLARLHTLAGR